MAAAKEAIAVWKFKISKETRSGIISGLISSLVVGLVITMLTLYLTFFWIPSYIQSIAPHPAISIEELKVANSNVTELLITNTGNVPMSYLSIQLVTPGLVNYSIRNLNSINFRFFGGPATDGLNIMAENILPGDAGYIVLYYPKGANTTFSIQKLSSDATSGMLYLSNSINSTSAYTITCNQGACTWSPAG